MSLDEQVPQTTASSAETAETAESSTSPAVINKDEEILARERSEKLTEAKELYSNGSRNFLVKIYTDAADELSRVCTLYSELYGELADELGMPFLLYAKSLIALSLDENKVVDVPDEEDDDEEDEEGEEDKEENAEEASNDSEVVSSNSNGNPLVNGKHGEADSSVDAVSASTEKEGEDALVSSTDDGKTENGTTSTSTAVIRDDEKPSTSNGVQHVDTEDVNMATAAATEEEDDAATNLQLAWEILEMAAKIFLRQGANGLPNLAEVQCELGNIQFENCILDAARNDYEKSLKIYYLLEQEKYRRAMAEIHYKIGLSYLMEQMNKEGAASLKEACQLIQGEIDEIKAKEDLNEKDRNNIKDMEETKQEIEAKIVEIEEMQAQQIADVRAALDSYIKPIMANAAAEDNDAAAGTSSSSSSTTSAAVTTANVNNSAATSSASAVPQKKANDISHLIKRKKPESNSEAEAAASPAKRPAL